jgi:hypothetical protein
MIYITGDTHRNFNRIMDFCERFHTTEDDTLIILGDAGLNYCGDAEDVPYQKMLARHLPIKMFCVHGNHEERPQNIPRYKEVMYKGALAMVDPEIPNIVFGIDGQVYDFDGKKCLVCGGAYSADKYYRLAHNRKWFESEQPDEITKSNVLDAITDAVYVIPYVLTHTCPKKFTPTEMFLPGIDQSTVDDSTERFLDVVDDNLWYKTWYCGHWHTDKTVIQTRQNENKAYWSSRNVDSTYKIRFLFNDIIELGE